ncbi:hypothetical protein CC86DRAFT_256776, partial [Ophiobolus disseminans]
ATHSLQPLDVVMFKLLSSKYSQALTTFTHKSLGLLPVKKGDLILLFQTAWLSSFKKDLILKAFKATGVWPRNREAVLKKFKQQHPANSKTSNFTSLEDAD